MSLPHVGLCGLRSPSPHQPQSPAPPAFSTVNRSSLQEGSTLTNARLLPRPSPLHTLHIPSLTPPAPPPLPFLVTSLPSQGLTIQTVTLEAALALLALPRTLGLHPEDGQPVVANSGMFGPYVAHGGTSASLGKRATPEQVSSSAHVAGALFGIRGLSRGQWVYY